MSPAKEVELKLELAPADRGRLRRSAIWRVERGPTIRLVSDYFDTNDRALQAAGYSLRLRSMGKTTLQTVKAKGNHGAGLFERPEWERAIDGKLPILDEGTDAIREVIGDRSLSVQFTTDVRRTIRVVAAAESTIEIAFDDGEVRDESVSQPLCELELELKEGLPKALFSLARRINERIPLRLGVLSKSERGYALNDSRAVPAVRAEPVTLDATGDPRTAFATIAQNSIRQFRLNEALLMESGSPESLHQARVGLRRLRSAFSLFKPLLQDDVQADHLRSELRWLASALGEVRNLDVLIGRVDDSMRDRLESARATAFEQVRRQLSSSRTRSLMLDLAEWLAIGAWREAACLGRKADQDITQFATTVLARHRRRIMRAGRRLVQLDDDARHAVRIEAKKLRYATEFFGSLFADKAATRHHKVFLNALEELQDQLGELNDWAISAEVFASLGLQAPEPLRLENRHELLEKANAALSRLADTKRFWR